MSKILVVYFSASGNTAKVARMLSAAVNADIFEIIPVIPYSKADLNWMDKNSRSSVEMSNDAYRPAIKEKCKNIDKYDILLIGFPIWWYVAPTIVNTFLETYDLSGKTIIPFATSGSRGIGKTNEKLQPSCPNSQLLTGKVFHTNTSDTEIISWIDSLKLS